MSALKKSLNFLGYFFVGFSGIGLHMRISEEMSKENPKFCDVIQEEGPLCVAEALLGTGMLWLSEKI